MQNDDAKRKNPKKAVGKKKRHVSEKEPKPTRILEGPPQLAPAARQEWDRIVGELTRLGVLSSFDLGTLVIYCNAFALYFEAMEMVNRHGAMIKSGNGFPMQSPWLSAANKHADTMMRIASEFGFTPASRSRNFSFTKSNSMLLEAAVEDAMWPTVPQMEASEPRNVEIEIELDDEEPNE
jgi:P27 family predicted phage terminase small subunit